MSCLDMHSSQRDQVFVRSHGARPSPRMDACLLALLVAAGCFEDCGGSSPSGATTPVDFHGELACAFGSSAPVFMVSLEAGECAFVPRCGELGLQKAILKTVDSSVGFAVVGDAGSASNLTAC